MEFIIGILVLLGGVYLVYKLLGGGEDSAGIAAISDKVMSEDEKETLFNSFVADAAAGKLEILQQTNLVLKRGEYLVFDLPGIGLCEERSVRVRGGHQGFSVRVAKGVSYRFGGFSAQAEREVTQIDTGRLIITNKRMVFSGQAASKDVRFSQINIVRPQLDGIVIARSGKQKMEYYLGTDDITINLTINEDGGDGEGAEDARVVDWKLSGVEVAAILRELIEG